MRPDPRGVGFTVLGVLLLLVAIRVAWRGVGGGVRKGSGAAAPAFHLPLLAGGTLDVGGPGEVTLVDFFATWCGPCREELPHVDALAQKYKGRGVRVVAVDVEPPEARAFVEKLARDLHLSLPIAVGGDGVAEQYRVESLPTVVVLDAEGRLSRVMLGAHSEAELQSLVEAAR